MRVHIICHGNGLRSIMAEAYIASLNRPGLEVSSSGTAANFYMQTGQPVSYHALETLQAHGIKDYAKQHRDQLDPTAIKPKDVLVCVSPAVYEECRQLIDLPERTYVWHVDDIGEGDHVAGANHSTTELFEEIFEELKQNADKLVATL
jgi:protein-tyrosine-phosphatase